MFEYMGKGLPIIMTNFPLWEEFNQNYHCGLTIDIFDLDGEKKRICDFLQNWEMLQKIGKNNVENVMKNFTWEIEEKKLLDIYGKLLVDK